MEKNDLFDTLTGPPHMQPPRPHSKLKLLLTFSLMVKVDERTYRSVFKGFTHDDCIMELHRRVDEMGIGSLADYDILPLADGGRFGNGLYDY